MLSSLVHIADDAFIESAAYNNLYNADTVFIPAKVGNQLRIYNIKLQDPKRPGSAQLLHTYALSDDVQPYGSKLTRDGVLIVALYQAHLVVGYNLIDGQELFKIDACFPNDIAIWEIDDQNIDLYIGGSLVHEDLDEL